MADIIYPTSKAARDGDIKKLRYLIEKKGYPIEEMNIMSHAVYSNSVPILEYLFNMEEQYVHISTRLTEEAAALSNYDAFMWLVEKDVEISDGCLPIATKSGCLPIIKQLYYMGCWHIEFSNVGYRAAKRGHIHILKFLKKKDLYMTGCCLAAASRGQFETLKYLRSINSYWDSEVCEVLVEFNNLKMLRWCIDHGCPHDVEKLLEGSRGKRKIYLKSLIEGTN